MLLEIIFDYEYQYNNWNTKKKRNIMSGYYLYMLEQCSNDAGGPEITSRGERSHSRTQTPLQEKTRGNFEKGRLPWDEDR